MGMTVPVLTWLFGCGPAPAPDAGPLVPGAEDAAPPARDAAATPRAPAPDAAPAPAAPPDAGSPDADANRLLPVRLVLERGRIGPDGWESLPAGADTLQSPPATRAGETWIAQLPAGPAVARVARAGCGAVEVPYNVGPVGLVVLPYPACDPAPDAPPVGRVRLDRTELAASWIEVLHGLELFRDVPAPAPGEEDGPARWLTLEDARGICAWRGGRLPTEAEWRSARAGAAGAPVANATRAALGSGPAGAEARRIAGVTPLISASGHHDLDGNVEEWLADSRVAGGSWAALPEELGAVRVVPADARTDTIGARCVFDG